MDGIRVSRAELLQEDPTARFEIAPVALFAESIFDILKEFREKLREFLLRFVGVMAPPELGDLHKRHRADNPLRGFVVAGSGTIEKEFT